ncbi:MAG: Fic family protein, partial [Chitinophagaceae bacterium]
TYAKQILQRLLIDLAWNSSRLEGNTYSLLDTQRLLDQGVTAGDKSASETQMILNHKDAIEFIVTNTEGIGINRYTILSLHALLSNNLLPNPAASGSLRIHSVGITGSVYIPPGMPQFIEEMFEQILDKAARIEDPFEQAFFIMVQLPYLQPFDDVNKRVSRLAANIPLNKKNLSPLSFVEVPGSLYIEGLLGVYELNRVELLKDIFLWAYDRSAKQYAAQRQSLGEPDAFRLQYRELIRSVIQEIVSTPHSKGEAIIMIKASSLRLPGSDQERFVQTVENELVSLHEGNFARYFVRPSQFKDWQKVWNRV